MPLRSSLRSLGPWTTRIAAASPIAMSSRPISSWTKRGAPRVLDFGVAELSNPWRTDDRQEEGLSGTPAFMAPEQVRGELTVAGPRSDVFCLGGTLYFLLTGSAPFAADTMLKAMERARRCDWDRTLLDRAGVPSQLRAICAKAMAQAPADRYASAAKLAEALERFRCSQHRPAHASSCCCPTRACLGGLDSRIMARIARYSAPKRPRQRLPNMWRAHRATSLSGTGFLWRSRSGGTIGRSTFWMRCHYARATN